MKVLSTLKVEETPSGRYRFGFRVWGFDFWAKHQPQDNLLPAGETALMKAAANGHWDVCEFLITEGAKATRTLNEEFQDLSSLYRVWNFHQGLQCCCVLFYYFNRVV